MAVYILMFSSVVTLLSTVLQLGLEYQRDIGDIENLLGQVQQSYSESLSSSLWNTSQKDLELQLKGILRLPDVVYAEVTSDSGQVVASVGAADEKAGISREFSLYYTHRQQQVWIGKVRTVATVNGVYRRLRDKILVILITQTIKTFLVSLFILFLFQWLVGRHLKKIASHSDQMAAEKTTDVLRLDRSQGQRDDELEQVVHALNDMHGRLLQSFSTLKELLAETEQARSDLSVANETMEEQVRLRTAQLQAANQELEAFSYSVSHDLRSPLRGIDGWSLALQEDYAEHLDQTGQEYLERVRKETQRMGELIDGMLQFSRYGRSDLTVLSVDLSTMAADIAARITETNTQRNYHIQIQPHVKATADPRLLDVVLTNLLENASKFTGTRALAEISVGYGESLDPENGALRKAYFVRDNGVGFDMNYAQKLFGVFQRMHKASEFPGTGIGLATVQRIIQRHGGRIWAESVLGQGSCFYFVLKSTEEMA